MGTDVYGKLWTIWKKWKLIWRQYIEEEFFKVKQLFGVVCHIAENVKSLKLLI